MKPKRFVFFRKFLKDFAESAFLHDQIDSVTCDRLRSWAEKPGAREYANGLFRDNITIIPEVDLRLQLKTLREIDGTEFHHIEVITSRRNHRKKKCFVGHRFLPAIERALRWNLRQVLEPYGIELDWSGRDIRSVQILNDIVRRIKAADFCVFDNRATKGRPNVYIEAGMCIALGKPFILFEHESSSIDKLNPGAIPSDLTSALALRYKNYKQLFREFYFRLPVFFEENLD